MKSERGLLVLPLAMFLTIAIGAAFLLVPSITREETIEGQRRRHEQAYAAAEGAVALALHRAADIPETRVGRAKATADYLRTGDRVEVTATARVPALRDGEVVVELTRAYRVGDDGRLTPVR